MIELSSLQKQVLDELAKSPLKDIFYWTGGTLLSAVYLHHRLSQDLDFFSDTPFSHDTIVGFVGGLKDRLALDYIEEKKIHDRWEFFLHNKEELRLEFVHYNHPKVGERKDWRGVVIDSLDDAATNKLMALVDRDEPKDVVDLYFLLTQSGYTVEQLAEFAEKKFGVRLIESVVWSEAFKGMRSLDSIEPFLLGETDEDRKKTLNEIRDYFNKKSKDFLNKNLD